MPADDISHPIPDLTGYIAEGQIVLSRVLASAVDEQGRAATDRQNLAFAQAFETRLEELAQQSALAMRRPTA